jgi:UDPglucose 6-dehydrogenase
MSRKIAVVGLGKLGLPLAALFANAGHKVKAYDASEKLMYDLNNERFFSTEPGLMNLLSAGKHSLEYCFSLSQATAEVDVIFIIVPTPSRDDGWFSNRAILDVLENLNSENFSNRKVVIDVVSTVMPGSCLGEIRLALESRLGQKLGASLGLCYNPEFIALGSVVENMQKPDMHLLGQSDTWAGDVIEEILSSVVTKQVPCRRMGLTEAELVKIAVNNFVTMKISYANLLFQAAISLGEVDIDIVTDAIGLDSRIGGKYLKGAAPYGGPCFPRDTRALTALYDQIGVPADLSKATENVNNSHVSFVGEFVSDTVGIAKTIGLIGISYKQGTPVVEESPGIAIARDLISKGFNLVIWDDENAQIPLDLADKVDLVENVITLVEKVDFVVITRPLVHLDLLMQSISQNKKPYLDLWRQQK